MPITEKSKTDLKWWLERNPIAKKKFKEDDFNLDIHTASSLSGWGATNGKNKIHGFWDNLHKDLS